MMLYSTAELQVGQFVKSRAGRDKDKIFIVISIVDDNYVQIADGKSRKLDNTKLKKVKHLNALNLKSEAYLEALASHTKPTDAFIRKEVMTAYLSCSKEG